MTPQTLFIGHHLIRKECVDSTNNYAAKLLSRTNVQEGTVILAEKQTAGRGQRGTSWDSQAGENILMSLVLTPKFLKVTNQFALSQVVALALVDCFAEFGVTAKIKWPNDIYVGRFKLAGILIENTLKQQHLEASVLGIGVNVNQSSFALPQATSLAKITGRYFELEKVLHVLFRYLEKWYLKLRQQGVFVLREAYLPLLYRLNEQHTYFYKEQEIEATIKGVDVQGMLILELKDGSQIACDLKEIKFT